MDNPERGFWPLDVGADLTRVRKYFTSYKFYEKGPLKKKCSLTLWVQAFPVPH